MTDGHYKRKLTAILSADVVGYSSLMDDNEEETIRTLKSYRSAISTLIGHNQGRVVDMVGDNLLAEFKSAVDAVNCGIEIQQEIVQRNIELPASRKMDFRIGINVGDVVEENGRIYGDGVNIAARMEGLAEACGICISGRVYDQVENKLDLTYKFLGEHKVKNISRPIGVYVIDMASHVADPDAGERRELPAKPSIAVLPFLNMSSDADQEYFSDGITQDIITALSKFRWFFVIARNSSFSYKGKTIEVKAVAQELGVRYILQGSVRKAGRRVRITAELIEASSGYNIWADRYDRDLEDVFAVQDEITHNIVRSVGSEFISAEMKRAQRKGFRNLDVWDYTMKASTFHSRYMKKDTIEAQSFLSTAIELDPMNSEAFCLLACTYLAQVQFGWSESARKSIMEAEKAAQSAVAIDDRDAWAHTALGLVDLMSKRYDDAIYRLEKAIDLNPNLANAYGALGQAQALVGEYEAAVTHINKAIRLSPTDPFAPYWFGHLGVASFADERYEDACFWGRKTIQLNPQFPGGHRLLASSCGQLGRISEAEKELKIMLNLMPGMTSDDVRKQVPFKRSADMERYIDGLRKAGLKD
jgi:TolB-like protein/Flp pilus assembly protein TadD